MTKPTPPEGYRLAEPGETYYPQEGDKPAYWWLPRKQNWVCWVMPLTTQALLPITEEEYEGLSEDWATFAVPLTTLDELTALNQEIGPW